MTKARTRRARVAVLTAGLCLAFPAALYAQEPTPAQLVTQAREKLAAGETDAACLLLEQAYQGAGKTPAIDAPPPDPTAPSANDVLFELAKCHEKQGKGTLAAGEFDQVGAAGGTNAEEAKQRATAIRAPIAPAPPVGEPVTPLTPTKPQADVKIEPAKKDEPPPVRVGDFMDTRLTWTFGDDDILKETGVAFPLSPNASIGDRRQYRLFFDNLNSRFAGRENLTHLSLYKQMPGFIDGLDTEASLVLRFDIASLAARSNNLNNSIYDAGSFLRAFYKFNKDPESKMGLGITFWPLDTDRFRLGYLYDISWGGTAVAINQSIFPRLQGSAPGAKLQFDHDRFHVFVGFKTATIVQVEETLTPGTSEVEEIRIGETNYGVLGGGGVDITDFLRADVGGGYFQQGKFDLPDVAGEDIYTAGVSARVIVHDEMPVPQSIDFQLYRNDPNKPMIIFKPATYVDGKTAWSASIEGTHLWQNLKVFEEVGATALQPARTAALQGNLQTSYFRASLTGIYRDLPYVLRNQPSFIPFQTLPADDESVSAGNEFFVAAAADYHIKAAHLTPGLGAGVQFPATFKTNSIDASGGSIGRTVVVREQGNIAILPVNEDEVPIIQARVSLRWDLSTIFAAVAWAQFVYDNNATFVERDPNEGTIALRTFVSPTFFGLGTAVQARF